MGGGGVTTTNSNSVTGQQAFDEAMSAYQGLIQSMWTTNLPNGGFNYTQPSGLGGTGTSRGDRRFIPRIDDGGGGGMGSAGMGNLNPGGLGGNGTPSGNIGNGWSPAGGGNANDGNTRTRPGTGTGTGTASANFYVEGMPDWWNAYDHVASGAPTWDENTFDYQVQYAPGTWQDRAQNVFNQADQNGMGGDQYGASQWYWTQLGNQQADQTFAQGQPRQVAGPTDRWYQYRGVTGNAINPFTGEYVGLARPEEEAQWKATMGQLPTAGQADIMSSGATPTALASRQGDPGEAATTQAQFQGYNAAMGPGFGDAANPFGGATFDQQAYESARAIADNLGNGNDQYNWMNQLAQTMPERSQVYGPFDQIRERDTGGWTAYDTAAGALLNGMVNEGTREQQAVDQAAQMQALGGQTPDLGRFADTVSTNPVVQNALRVWTDTALPTIQNQAALAGLGRSGALLKNIESSQNQFLTPIIQQQLGLEENAINRQMQGAQTNLSTLLDLGGRARTGAQAGYQANMGLAGTRRDIARTQDTASNEDFLRRQALAENNAGRYLQGAQSAIGSGAQATDTQLGRANAAYGMLSGLGNTQRQAGWQQADTFNQANLQNANMFNQNQQYNAGQANQMAQFNAGQRANQGQFNAQQANQMAQFNTGNQLANNQWNAGQYNQAAQQNAARRQQGTLDYGNALGQMTGAYDARRQGELANIAQNEQYLQANQQARNDAIWDDLLRRQGYSTDTRNWQSSNLQNAAAGLGNLGGSVSDTWRQNLGTQLGMANQQRDWLAQQEEQTYNDFLRRQALAEKALGDMVGGIPTGSTVSQSK